MALSLAQRHQRRTRAALEARAAAPTQSMAGATAYEHQLMQLTQDRLRLKQVQSEQGKATLKRQLLPEYGPYVQGVLSAGNGAQDDVLTTLMVWNLDAEDYPAALAIARYVLEHSLKMPDRFARTTGCLVAEEVANAALKTQKAGTPFALQVLLTCAALTDKHDMPDQARAKLALAIGKAWLDEEATATTPEQALASLGQAKAALIHAIELHSNCGGKKDLEKVERLLKKHAAPAAP